LVVSGTSGIGLADATVAGLYAAVAAGEAAIFEDRKDSPQVIVMAPRRWSWIKSQFDGNDRPLVSPVAPSNAPATFGNGAAEGFVGEFYGYPVIVSHAVPTNVSGTQDEVIIAKLDDCRLYEGGTRTLVDMNSLSNKRGVRFVWSGYVGFTAERSPESIAVVSGAGLTDPFAIGSV
jgi:hypothetical protein